MAIPGKVQGRNGMQAVLSGFEPRAIGSIAVLLVLLGGIGYGAWSVLQEVQKVWTPKLLGMLEISSLLDQVQ